MSTERARILQLLATGTINAEEAARLLDSIAADEAHDSAREEGRSARIRQDAQRMQGKKLRVEVKGNAEEAKKLNVNVSIPLVLARHADNIIANCIPTAVNTELQQQGIDLRGLNIGAIIDTFETLDEDIVQADIVQDNIDLKVRVYVE